MWVKRQVIGRVILSTNLLAGRRTVSRPHADRHRPSVHHRLTVRPPALSDRLDTVETTILLSAVIIHRHDDRRRIVIADAA